MRLSKCVAGRVAGRISLGLAALGAMPAFGATYVIEKVAATGDTGGWVTGTIDAVEQVTLDNLGNVYFSGVTDGGTINGTWAVVGGVYQTIIELPVPLDTVSLEKVQPSSASNGKVVLNGIAGVDGNEQIRFWTLPVPVNPVLAEKNSPAAGVSGDYSGLNSLPAMSTDGYAYFVGSYDTASPKPAVWRGNASGTSLVVDGNTLAINTLAVVDIGQPTVNGSGTVAFKAGNGNGVSGVFRGTNLLVAEGQALGGATVTAVGDPRINNAGTVAVWVDTSAGNRIYTENAGLTLQVAAGVNYAGVGTVATLDGPVINGAGTLAFSGTVTGSALSDNFVAITDGMGGLDLVAKEGQSLSGIGVNASFLQSSDFATFSSVSINGNGQVLFAAGLLDDALPVEGDAGLFLWDPVEGLKLLVRVGDTLPGGGVASLLILQGTSGGEDGYGASLNDAGQVLFQAYLDEFTGTGAYLISPEASEIPEPASLGVLGLGALALLKRRR